jgi:hypothetical protein
MFQTRTLNPEWTFAARAFSEAVHRETSDRAHKTGLLFNFAVPYRILCKMDRGTALKAAKRVV